MKPAPPAKPGSSLFFIFLGLLPITLSFDETLTKSVNWMPIFGTSVFVFSLLAALGICRDLSGGMRVMFTLIGMTIFAILDFMFAVMFVFLSGCSKYPS